MLEKQRNELQADIQEAYLSDEMAEAMQQKVQQLQQEMQQIVTNTAIANGRDKRSNKGEETTKKSGDSLEISDKANLLYAQTREE
ncbi:hypothetical protein NGI46_09245 [Peribacillus butanolivorans]|uniref:hypothetical protein n=1 Tax=Peribacillus butanolivorans TaxID=421767 RepID=UPI00207CDB0F|nr:hypothetical protein [Peribacillus butanolivorans]MCO0597653.1 hypothetical protein [Peribacillus butanolivorans]